MRGEARWGGAREGDAAVWVVVGVGRWRMRGWGEGARRTEGRKEGEGG